MGIQIYSALIKMQKPVSLKISQAILMEFYF